MAVYNPYQTSSDPWNGLYNGGAKDSLPSTGGAPQSNAQSIWEAGANGLGSANNFASPTQLQNLGVTAIPNPVTNYNQSAPSTITPMGGGASGGAAGTSTPGGQAASPWLPNVTSTSMDGSVTPFSTPGNPNINYINQGAAADLARRYGANLVSSGNVMGGSVSDPMYGLDFGSGDAIGAGQIAAWEQRNRETPGSDTP